MTKFSQERSRDINAGAILTHHSQLGVPSRIDITVDNSKEDSHVRSYDCSGAVSLNSSMQSNVPTPFGGMHKFSHLNMPGNLDTFNLLVRFEVNTIFIFAYLRWTMGTRL